MPKPNTIVYNKQTNKMNTTLILIALFWNTIYSVKPSLLLDQSFLR